MNDDDNSIRLTIRVNKKLLDEFDDAIKNKDTNRSREIRECMRKYIENFKKQQEVKRDDK